MNAFALLTRTKTRFNSPRGMLTIEDLWDLPLTSNSISLDSISTILLKERDEAPRKSLVVKTSKKNKVVEAKIEVLKYIISIKQDELEAKEQEVHNAAKRDQIINAIADIEQNELKSKSKSQLLKE